MVDLGSRSIPGLSKSAFPPKEGISWELPYFQRSHHLCWWHLPLPASNATAFQRIMQSVSRDHGLPGAAHTKRAPLSFANTHFVFSPPPQPSHSTSFPPIQREQSLTALQNLPERDQILPKAIPWRCQDRFSVTEKSIKSIKSTLPQNLLAEGCVMKGQHSCSSGTLWGLGDSDIRATLHHLTESPCLSNAIISSGLAGKLD